MKKLLTTAAITLLMVAAPMSAAQAKSFAQSPRTTVKASSVAIKCMPNTHAYGRYCVPNDPDLRGPKYGR